MAMNNYVALRDRLDAIGKALDANHFDQETVDRLLAEAMQISEAQFCLEVDPPKLVNTQSSIITQARAMTAKPAKSTQPDRFLKIMEDDRKVMEYASIRAERTIDLLAWAESSAREIAELEQTMSEDQDWFIGLYRRDLALAQKELVRRERLESPPILSGADVGIDWPTLIERVKAIANLVELLEAHGVELKRHGTRYKAHCPFHSDDTPSLVVYPGPPQNYYCFGCGAHGDAISFVQSTKNLCFLEAIKYLAEVYYLPLPVNPSSNKKKEEHHELD